MLYSHISKGIFISRPNRFEAFVDLGAGPVLCHVKNTGRCRELLIPGVTVYVDESGNPARKTRYDLVAVEKAGLGTVNIDSQAPNAVVREWLALQGFDRVVPEYTFGNSRIDFYMEKSIGGDVGRILMEVKGCTLEIDGTGYFPDAPTDRGRKHLDELIRAREQGFRAIAAFVIQMEGITEVLPNAATDPGFAERLRSAKSAGVEVVGLTCSVTPDSLVIKGENRFLV
ncbi:MAG: DNA/RNA nuclease SfsA [Clostridia bacterium]|nr:DNA/RNA nuclease SfsA [Clostridia bacterium]